MPRPKWSPVKAEEFDEEAELQARIWAGLVRKGNGESLLIVEAESIVVSLMEISQRS